MCDGVQCMVYSVWCTVYGVWCMVYGVWCNGVWCNPIYSVTINWGFIVGLKVSQNLFQMVIVHH